METLEREGTKVGAWPSLFTGLVAGAALGVWFAPRAGKESRAKLRDWLRQKREVSRHVIAARKERIGAAVSAARSAYSNEHADIGG